MSVTISLTDAERNALVYLCDKVIGGLEKWADTAHYDIDADDEYKALCRKLTDIEMGGTPAKLSDVLKLSDEIHHWESTKIYHCWDVVSDRTGEIFTLFGQAGQSFEEAMAYNGLSCEVWKRLARRW